VEFVIVVEHVETETLRDDRPEEEKEQRNFTNKEIEESLLNGKHIELEGRADIGGRPFETPS
jgi:hypothetical protein